MTTADYGTLRPRVVALRRRNKHTFFDSADHFLNPQPQPARPHPRLFSNSQQQQENQSEAKPSKKINHQARMQARTGRLFFDSADYFLNPSQPSPAPHPSLFASPPRSSSSPGPSSTYGDLTPRTSHNLRSKGRSFFDSAEFVLNPEQTPSTPHPALFNHVAPLDLDSGSRTKSARGPSSRKQPHT
eukprot:CAMPEP_0177647768 /NCGR_PEP_ID=MMETSP0447-20121125/10475_1 /TAXON_ID=0 /ORGANISM="Stygamoeba regulata, Strain BSH-02190019" /LENGTH=185 /DNA_ID=CAMNT_0019150373 /DNA_START=247 /DNA_END=804 /DNA_ORIENTATION=-